MAIPSHDVEELSRAVTGRTRSVFEQAIERRRSDLEEMYRGARVLVTGGAGFIGGQALRLILAMKPERVVVIDTWENGLAELVRDLRSEGAIAPETAFEPRLADVTSPLAARCIAEDGPFDVALAFAAAKHVRTERDAVSALHMLNVNINGTYRALAAAHSGNPRCRLFMVSTDKAADPASLMGASKRVMEEYLRAELPSVTTTRFANVAFSSGSLLESWLTRLSRGHVLPVPAETSRYFVRPAEAGQLCLLASSAPPGSIVVPSEGVIDSTLLTDALARVLDGLGLQWLEVDPSIAVGAVAPAGSAFVIQTPRDTAGEKAAETFVGRNEGIIPWLPSVDRVDVRPARPEAGTFARWVADAASSTTGPSVAHVVRELAQAIPEFRHVSSERRLDDRI